MYENCIKCSKLGTTCDGPDFMAMDSHDLISWCRERKAALGLSNAKLAELSNMPKGTVDRILSGSHEDFKYSTVRPILKVLVGGEWGQHPCPYPNDNAAPETIMGLREAIAEKNSEILRQRKVIKALAIALGVLVTVVICILIYDRMNPNVGWFRDLAYYFDHNNAAPAFSDISIAKYMP